MSKKKYTAKQLRKAREIVDPEEAIEAERSRSGTVKRKWDFLAIAAVVLGLAGLAVMINPAPTGDVRRDWILGAANPCKSDEKGVVVFDGGSYRTWDCTKLLPFSPESLPLAGVLAVAALVILGLRSQTPSVARR